MSGADIIQGVSSLVVLGVVGWLVRWIYTLYKERERTLKQSFDSEKQLLEQRLKLKDEEIAKEKDATRRYKLVADEYKDYLQRQLEDVQRRGGVSPDVILHVEHLELAGVMPDALLPAKLSDPVELPPDLKQELGEILSALERIEMEMPVPDAHTLFIRGNAYSRTGNYRKAVEAYTRAIELEPDKVSSHFNRALAFRCLREYEAALADLNWVASVEPILDVFCVRSTVFNALADYHHALEDASKVTQLDGSHAAAYGNKGIAYAGLGQFESALQEFTKAIELEPADPQGHFFRAMAYAELNRHEEARRDFQKVIEVAPDDARGYLNRGAAYANLDDLEQALKDLDMAIQLQPDLTPAYINRAKTLAEMERYAQAIDDCNLALKLESDNAEAYYARARIQWKLKELHSAVTDFSKAIELTPHLVEAYCSRGRLYTQLEDYQAAVYDFNKLLELDPNHLSAYPNRAVAYAKLGDRQKAIDDLKKTLEWKPDDADACYNMACLYSLMNQADEALHWLQKAISIDSEFLEMARKDDDFDNINTDPRFKSLLGL